MDDDDDNGKSKHEIKNNQVLAHMTILLEHPRNARIRQDPRRRYGFVYNDTFDGRDIMLKGLKPALKSVFWPNYRYKDSYYGKNTRNAPTLNAWQGLERGKYVHQQLEDYINLTADEFTRRHSSLHFDTLRVIKTLRRWRLVPCIAEFIVYDNTPRCMVGTKIDALLSHADTGEFVLVDWKCGFDNYLLKGNSMMNGPAADYSNSPLNQAFLQVLFAKIFLERHYDFRVHSSIVVQIAGDAVIPWNVPAEMIALSDQLYDYFCESLTESRSRKRRR